MVKYSHFDARCPFFVPGSRAEVPPAFAGSSVV